MPQGFLRSFCEKTQLCKFHKAGICNKGTRCAFAHSENALRAVPNLSCTKICPQLLSKGECDTVNCRFAHSKDELRRLRRNSARSQQVAAPPLAEPQPKAAFASLELHVPEGILDENVACGGAVFTRNVSSCSTEASFEGLECPADFSRVNTPSAESNDGPVYLSERSQTDSDDSEQEMEVGHIRTFRSVPEDHATRNMFHKTRMCRFFQGGRCRKGSLCRFAHGEVEQRPPPDLSCTKLCPRLLKGGSCPDASCTFAHSPEELRAKPRHQEATVVALRAGAKVDLALARAEDMEDEEAVQGQASPDAEWTLYRLPGNLKTCIKNTFIDIEEPQPESLRRRSSSAPPRSCSHVCNGAEDTAEDATEDTSPPPQRRRLQAARFSTWSGPSSTACGEESLPISLPGAIATGAGHLAAQTLPRRPFVVGTTGIPALSLPHLG